MRKLFVDDERDFPDGWDIARNYEDAITLLKLVDYAEISLDHDIASYDATGKEWTGYDILCVLEQYRMVYNKKIPYIFVHTANAAVAAMMQKVADKLNAMGNPDA